jgi:hypothetical protein
VRLTGKRVEDIGGNGDLRGPAVRHAVLDGPDVRLRREVGDEYVQATEAQGPLPEEREIDAVEPLEIGFYGVGVLAEEGKEPG